MTSFREGVGLGILVAALSACTARTPPLVSVERPERPAEGGLRALAVARIDFAIPMISETDFGRLTRMGEAGPIHDADRAEAARAAALANSDAALGVEGPVQRRTRVSAPVFFVARDPVMTAHGTVESADFFVAAAALSGDVEWAAFRTGLLSAPSLSVTDGRGLEGCAHVYSEGDTALPRGVVVNLESRRRPVNASERTIELSLGSAPGPRYAESRFICAGTVLVEPASERSAPVKTGTLEEFSSVLSLPDDAVVISEADFYRALSATETLVVPKEAKAAAARLAAAASERTALGLQARFSERKAFNTSFAVVTRQVTKSGDMLGADEFYFVPLRLTGEAEWIGDRVRLGFDGEVPSFDFDQAPCDLVYTAGLGDAGCAGEMCIDSPHPWMGGRGGLAGPSGVPSRGGEPGRPRPTVRLFGKVGGTLDFRAIACTQFLTPPEREARQCGRTDSGRVTAEVCNGRDDDCNGQVDDGFVCDVVPMNCAPAAPACGAITCGEIPDGLGGVVSCGAPCP